MKIQIKNLKFIILLGLFACQKNDSTIKTYDEYLSDKSIVSIGVYNGNIWTLSTRICSECDVAPYMSYIPIISQLTRIKGSVYKFVEPAVFSVPKMDHQGNLFSSSQNKIFKVKDINDYSLYLETKNFNFYDFVFDQDDHIWLSGDNGIAFWNGTELKIYNTSNSLLPSNITHGLAIDRNGIIWVALDFKGLLKITGEQWEIIPNSEIPGLKTTSYLTSPVVDIENNIWFHVFNPDTTSSILKYNGNHWNYEYPNKNGYGIINVDAKGILWIINSFYENNTFKNSTLSYLNNGWIAVDVSMIDARILTVNSDEENIYIGTTSGLKKLKK